MIQKKFLCKDLPSAETAIDRIGELIRSTPHRSALITFYEKDFTKQEVESLTERMRGLGDPGLLIAGITATLIAELMPE